MNLLDTLGVTPLGGLLVAAAGLLAACVWGAWSFVRRTRAESRVGLGLEDR
jgi:tetrahydromethanopterin S-methyltransferase subunit C